MNVQTVDTYTGWANRFAVGFLMRLVTKHQGAIVNPVNQVPATLFVLVLLIVQSYLEQWAKSIAEPAYALFRELTVTILLFIGTVLAYLIIALVDDFFSDELSSELSLNTVYRPALLIVCISLVIVLLKFMAGEISVEAATKQQ